MTGEPYKADFDSIEVGIDWMKGTGFALQVDGNDLVHVTDIDRETGQALVRVFTSTDPDAAVLFEGTVNVLERRNVDVDMSEFLP